MKKLLILLVALWGFSLQAVSIEFLTTATVNGTRGGLKILKSGLYVFAEDILFTQINQTPITIIADDVTIDLNGKTLKNATTYGNNIGINIVSSNDKVLGKIRNHVVIKNGNLNNFNRFGILVDAGMRNLTLSNLSITSAASSTLANAPIGVFFNGNAVVPVRDVALLNCRFTNGRYGIFANSTNDVDVLDSLFERTTVSGVAINQSNVWEVVNGHFSNQRGTTGFLAQGCSFLRFNNCDFASILSSSSAIGLSMIGSQFGISGGHVIQNCSFNSNTAAAGSAVGLSFINTGSSLIRQCIANGNFSASASGIGYFMDPTSSGNLFENCVADGNHSFGPAAAGYHVQGTGNDFFSCTAKTNRVFGGGTGVGFNVTAAAISCSVQNCSAIGNAEGFRNDGASTLIGNFASGNTAGNYVGIGIFGFITVINGAQPVGGTFDERRIDNISVV